MLTTEQAGEELELTASRVRQLCRTGELVDAVKWGRDWMVPRHAVERYKVERKPIGYPPGRPRKQGQFWPVSVARQRLPLAQ